MYHFLVRDFIVVVHMGHEDDNEEWTLTEEKGLEPGKSVFPPSYSLFDPLSIFPFLFFPNKVSILTPNCF